MATKLTLVKGGKDSTGSSRGGGDHKSLRQRMTKRDWFLHRLYTKLALAMNIPFGVKLWATGKLGALHGKYNYPDENDFTEVPLYRNDR